MSRIQNNKSVQKEPKDDKDDAVLRSLKYYCRGRGCRHHGVPKYKPTALCFYIKGSECTHKEVWGRMMDILPQCPGAKILDIQFVPLAVHLDNSQADNRWVVTLNRIGARNALSGTMLHLKGQLITLRRYDDVIQLEYRKCSRADNVIEMVSRINNLDNAIEDK